MKTAVATAPLAATVTARTVCSFCGGPMNKRRYVDRDSIVDEYSRMWGITFSPEVLASDFSFTGLFVSQCSECAATGFTPKLRGGGGYYTELSEQFQGYYEQTRWEFSLVLDLLREHGVGHFVEIGCGAGHFLRAARDAGIRGEGVEIEEKSIRAMHAEGFTVRRTPPSDGRYDAVLMFQLLEHVEEPHEFLGGILPSLRPGGLLVISTPVAPSCCALDPNVLLLPPHHCWLPTEKAHRLLANRLGLQPLSVRFDEPTAWPLQYALRKRGINRSRNRIASYALKAGRLLRLKWARANHTILIVHRKRQSG